MFFEPIHFGPNSGEDQFLHLCSSFSFKSWLLFFASSAFDSINTITNNLVLVNSISVFWVPNSSYLACSFPYIQLGVFDSSPVPIFHV
jgi:hypothetical protein